ncbi:hypothetical protein FRC09_011237 [Ceratobasidium sp. 395]|nr:hypothetical protein FRC09_011237 [Ceratobasidium sp. 395]
MFIAFLNPPIPPRLVLDPQVSGKTVWLNMSQHIVHWPTYAGAQMLCSLRQGGGHVNVQRLVPWLDKLDRLCVTFQDDANLHNMIERLSAALELTFLRYISSNVKSGYTLLRLMAPAVMQIALADPILWPQSPTSNGISLAHALLSRHEITRYIFMDNISSLTFGVPLLIEYDASHSLIETGDTHPIHACPNKFIFSMTKINQWRVRRLNGCSEQDPLWKEIEKDTWGWRPICTYDPDSESRAHIVRVAAQEAWRHALLIYLYMGMCGVTSQDPRVQSSARQTTKLLDVAKSQFSTRMHLMAPVLLAAVCAKSEADRTKPRTIISCSEENKVPLMLSMKFADVLDHLWHGAAANGRPVTWNDYVNSRKAVIDVDV